MTSAEQRHLPLEGIRAFDLTTDLGSYCGRLMADLGADVIRIEAPGGSAERDLPPFVSGPDSLSLEFAFYNAGKRSVTLDLTTNDGKWVLDRLLATADLLLTSGGPQELAAQGLSPESLLERHPRLVHVAMSPFGLTGPLADAPASDLTLLAAGGLLFLAGDPDRGPVQLYGGQAALMVALHATVGALIALVWRDESACGQLVDCSAQEAIAHSTENIIQYFDLEGVVRHRTGSTPIGPGVGVYRCADGWIYLFTALGGRLLTWVQLLQWLEAEGARRVDELTGPQWHDDSWRQSAEAHEVFREVFEAFAASRTKMELYEQGQGYGVTLCPLAELEDVIANPQLVSRGFFREVPVAESAALVFPGPPYRFAGAEVGPRVGPPAIGADTVEVLREDVGLAPGDMEILRAAGVL